MGHCILCVNSKFDEEKGKWMCKARNQEIYILLNSSECRFYTTDLTQGVSEYVSESNL